ncbi:hypothetical protein Tco_1316911 [Tanacetum coccineum]
MEAHCVNLELKYQNQVLKEGQQGQFLNVQSNEAKVKNDIDIQKKGFAIAALKNELRKLTGNSVNTKFAKPSILGKPVGQPLKNQSVVRQPTAFKSERPRISKPRFASQVDVNNDLSKPVTTHYILKHNVFNANHDSCVIKFLKEVNSRAKVPSNKTTTRNKPVEQTRFAKKPERQIPKGHRFSIKNTSVVHKKTMTPRSCLRWKPTGRIFKTIGLRWVPTGKIFAFSTNKVDSEPPNGSKEDITNQCESESSDCHAGTLLNYRPRSSMFKRCLIAADQASVFMEMTSVHISSGLVLHQMTSDHNRSELGIQDHSNEQSSSKLVPKVVPLAVKTATSRQELELLFHHHIAMLRTTEHPSDTNVFTMKMEILLEPASNKLLVAFKIMQKYGAVVKKHKIARKAKKIKTNDKAQSQDRKAEGISQQQINEDKDQEHSSLNDKSNLTDLMKECHQ